MTESTLLGLTLTCSRLFDQFPLVKGADQTFSSKVQLSPQKNIYFCSCSCFISVKNGKKMDPKYKMIFVVMGK